MISWIIFVVGFLILALVVVVFGDAVVESEIVEVAGALVCASEGLLRTLPNNGGIVVLRSKLNTVCELICSVGCISLFFDGFLVSFPFSSNFSSETVGNDFVVL